MATSMLVGEKLTPITVSATTLSGKTVAPRNLSITVDDNTLLNIDMHAPGLYSPGKSGTAHVTFTSSTTSNPTSAPITSVQEIDINEDPIVSLTITFPKPTF